MDCIKIVTASEWYDLMFFYSMPTAPVTSMYSVILEMSKLRDKCTNLGNTNQSILHDKIIHLHSNE